MKQSSTEYGSFSFFFFGFFEQFLIMIETILFVTKKGYLKFHTAHSNLLSYGH